MEALPFKRAYKRDHFDCGKPSLNNYLQRNATKDVKNGACTCFVLVNEKDEVLAYYTLSTDTIPIDSAPEAYKKKIKYPTVPVILLGRLAIDTKHSGKGYGKFLLIDALKRSLDVTKNHIGAVAIVVDPIDADATSYYLKYGFTELPDSGRMFMSMRKIDEAFSRNI